LSRFARKNPQAQRAARSYPDPYQNETTAVNLRGKAFRSNFKFNRFFQASFKTDLAGKVKI
jgi:hypothetical protein